MFETAKWLFGLLVTHSSYTSIYGAFAVVPLFLLWIYFLWVLILIGAELVRSLETFRYSGRGKAMPDLLAVLMILWQCWRRQQRGKALTDRSMSIVGLDAEHWRRLRNLLLEKHVLEKTARGEYVLIRDLASISVTDVVDWLGGNFLSSPVDLTDKVISSHPWYTAYTDLMAHNRSLLEGSMSVNVLALFSRSDEIISDK